MACHRLTVIFIVAGKPHGRVGPRLPLPKMPQLDGYSANFFIRKDSVGNTNHLLIFCHLSQIENMVRTCVVE